MVAGKLAKYLSGSAQLSTDFYRAALHQCHHGFHDLASKEKNKKNKNYNPVIHMILEVHCGDWRKEGIWFIPGVRAR